MSQERGKNQKCFFHLFFFLLCIFSIVYSTTGCLKCSGPYLLGIIARPGMFKPGLLTLCGSWCRAGRADEGDVQTVQPLVPPVMMSHGP